MTRATTIQCIECDKLKTTTRKYLCDQVIGERVCNRKEYYCDQCLPKATHAYFSRGVPESGVFCCICRYYPHPLAKIKLI